MRIMPSDGLAIVICNGSIELQLKAAVWKVNRMVRISMPELVINKFRNNFIFFTPFKQVFQNSSCQRKPGKYVYNAVNTEFLYGVL